MWQNWFPNGIFPSKRRGSNLQKRITTLYESDMQQQTCKNESPTLQALQKQKSKVKRMSSVYEANIAAFNETEKFSHKSDTLNVHNNLRRVISNRVLNQRPFAPPLCEIQVPIDPHNFEHYQKKFVAMDADYIKMMRVLIEKYVFKFGDEVVTNPETSGFGLIHQVNNVFPITSIYEFHKNHFHPTLLACENLSMFAENVKRMCKDGAFYPYIIYAMDEKESEHRRRVYYKDFMDRIMDKTGIYYDFEPIKQLHLYHKMIIGMLNAMVELRETISPETIIEFGETEAAWKDMLNMVYKMQNLQ